MPLKSIREMTHWERRIRSISSRSFITVLILVLTLGVVSTVFAFYLQSSNLKRECKTETWHLAHDCVLTMETEREKVEQKCREILNIYDSTPPKERGKGTGKAYQAKFKNTIDGDFKHIQQVMRKVQAENNDAVAAYIAALDEEKKRMIFLVDSDPKDTFCYPGYWDTYNDEIIGTFIYGSKPSKIDSMLGLDRPLPAVMVDVEKYGYRCTAAEPLFKQGKYHVMVFYDFSMEKVRSAGKKFLLQYVGILLIVLLLAGSLYVWRIRKTTVNPINQLAAAAESYSKDRQNHVSGGGHFENLDINTGDEIENLALTMKDMEKDLENYVDNLTRITAEKQRINTELDVASKIQEGMLPNIFPAFPDRSEFDIYGSMKTAKEVGGDFFDYFLVDDDHLVMIMADVSGKGIPAALFMMGSKIMLNNYAKMSGNSPAKILEAVNDQLCANNSADMFVTVWLGILEISTGKLKAANAGHEYPVIRSQSMGDGNGQAFGLYKEKNGFVLGGMEGLKYSEYEIQLQPGDIVFQYTDGVTEAIDKDNNMFGTDRLVNALNETEVEDVHLVISEINDAIDEFICGEPQFDDITMMCMKYYGKQK